MHDLYIGVSFITNAISDGTGGGHNSDPQRYANKNPTTPKGGNSSSRNSGSFF